MGDGVDRRAGEPRLRLVTLTLCELCLDGAGGECHVPGCALYMNRAPDSRVAAADAVDDRDRLTAKEVQTVIAAMAGNHPASLAQYRMSALRKLAKMLPVFGSSGAVSQGEGDRGPGGIAGAVIDGSYDSSLSGFSGSQPPDQEGDR